MRSLSDFFNRADMAGGRKHSSSFGGYQRKMYPVGTHLPSASCYGGSQRPSHGGFFKTHGRPHSSIRGGPHMSHYGDSHVNHKVAAYIFHHGLFNTLHHNLSKEKNRVSQSYGGDVHSHKNHTKTSGGRGFLNSHRTLNEKETMRLLNDRLSSYLGKIHSLEQENARLKKMISEWDGKSSPIVPIDQSQSSKDIQELQKQISSIITEKAGIVLQINTAKLALDNFKKKYEMDHNRRSNIEADVKALRSIWEGCKEETGKLESEVEILDQELLTMRRDSEQEINSLTIQLGPRVSVEVEAANSKDITKALSDIREHYENLIENNLREAENLFIHTAKKLKHVVVAGSEEDQSVQSTITSLKSSIQTMEIKLLNEQNMISSLQDTLAEKKAHYSTDLSQRQNFINIFQDALRRIRYRAQDLNETNIHLSKHNIHLELAAYQQHLDEKQEKLTANLNPSSTKDNVQTDKKVKEHPEGQNTKPLPHHPEGQNIELLPDHPKSQNTKPLSDHPEGQNIELLPDPPESQNTKPLSDHPEGQNTEPLSDHPEGQNIEPLLDHPESQNIEPLPDHPEGQNTEPLPDHPESQNTEPLPDHPEGQNIEPLPDHPEGQNIEPLPDHPESQNTEPLPDHPEGQNIEPLPDHPEGQNTEPLLDHPEVQNTELL